METDFLLIQRRGWLSWSYENFTWSITDLTNKYIFKRLWYTRVHEGIEVTWFFPWFFWETENNIFLQPGRQCPNAPQLWGKWSRKERKCSLTHILQPTEQETGILWLMDSWGSWAGNHILSPVQHLLVLCVLDLSIPASWLEHPSLSLELWKVQIVKYCWLPQMENQLA